MIINIDIPKETLKKYQVLADNDVRSRKRYIELKLIDDVKNINVIPLKKKSK